MFGFHGGLQNYQLSIVNYQLSINMRRATSPTGLNQSQWAIS